VKSPHAWTASRMRNEAFGLRPGHTLYYNAHLSAVSELGQLDQIVFGKRPDLVLQVSPGMSGGHDQAVIDALLKMQNLRALRLSVRKKQDFSALSGLQQIRYFGLIATRRVYVDFLADLPRLEELSLHGTPESLTPVSQVANLKKMFLCSITIDSLKCIQSLPKLAVISVDSAVFCCSPRQLGIDPLRHLSLTANRKLTDYSFLSRFTRLQSLRLSSRHMTTMPDLRLLTRLRHLVLNYLPNVAAIENIGTARAVESLELREINSRLKAEQFLFLARMPCLKKLCIDFMDRKKTRRPAVRALLESAGLNHLFSPGFLPHVFR
jgi:hypothetical protein